MYVSLQFFTRSTGQECMHTIMAMVIMSTLQTIMTSKLRVVIIAIMTSITITDMTMGINTSTVTTASTANR